jgi:hypothetical protein
MTKEPPADKPFFEQFTGPIDLSDGEPLTIAPLTKPAALMLAREVLIILPEEETPARELQDLKIISLGGLTKYMETVEESRKDAGAEFNHQSFLEAVNYVDRAFEDEYDLPNGMMILRHGERAILGRNISPQLDLSQEVSRVHTDITNSDEGVTFVDVGSRNGTYLYLSPEDAQQALPEKPAEGYISDELRDELLIAFTDLCDEKGDIAYKDERLDVFGGYREVIEDSKMAIELYINKASDFPELNSDEGFEWRRFTIDPSEHGVRISDAPAMSTKKPGVSKIGWISQMTETQAQQAMAMAKLLVIANYFTRS